ncbi:Mrr restriction system protein [Enterococcus sp. 669A]|uniref:Mrr restriction system protein n=2 Tax=Candidatus Enterococcus moelleringii TaxID=2815325 RepID=A0ABS3LA18_9ENTE|nr:Mrr restriction system protein [Enterococcus sp. 669A]MBO1306475.1 Mrr restriction system protein [Enterococcus sp. 669A]
MDVPSMERENLLMPEVIRCLRNLGGIASRNQVVNELKEAADIIPEDYIDFYRESKHTGNSYKPFNFQYNYAVKHLAYAGFVELPKRGTIKLTEKGRSVDLESFDSEEMVRKISEPIFQEKSQKKSKKVSTSSELEEINEDDDSVSQEDQWKEKLINALKGFSPQKFELFARSLVNAMGVDIDEKIGIKYIADGGLDGFGYITSDDFRTTRVAIQAKRWEGKVSSPEIDKFRGAMDKFNAEFGIFITTSAFTRDAIAASREGTRVITLINGDKIADLVAQHELYVTPVTTYVLDDDFYFEKN